jgi:hypothetical protein
MVVALLMVWLYVAVSILIIIQTKDTGLGARERLKCGFYWPLNLLKAAWKLVDEVYHDAGEFLLECIEDKK